MYFRGLITDHGDFKCLQNILSTLSKNGKECVLNIRPDGVVFIIRDEPARTLPLIWAELQKDACFSQYAFRGVNEENNEIMLVFNPLFLYKALGPIRVFEYVKIKLVKIQENSYLSVDILMISTISTEKKNIVHNIPVKVILPQKWELYCLPKIPSFHTIAELPNVKHIIDKYKNLSPTMTFFVNVSTCSIYLTIETDITTIIANFFNINVEHRWDRRTSMEHNTSGETGARQKSDEVSCQVDAKKLALLMNSVFYPVAQKCLLISQDDCVKFRFTLKENVTLYGIALSVSD